jgi:hypothetical protein
MSDEPQADADEQIASELETRVILHKRSQRRIREGVAKQAEIDAEAAADGAKELNPWDNPNVSGRSALYAFSSRETTKRIAAQFKGWLKLREDEEVAARKAVYDFIAANRHTIMNYNAPGHSSEFRRCLPGSISEYVDGPKEPQRSPTPAKALRPEVDAALLQIIPPSPTRNY